MYNLGEVIKDYLVRDIMNNRMTRERAIDKAIYYFRKDLLSEAQLREIIMSTTPSSGNG